MCHAHVVTYILTSLIKEDLFPTFLLQNFHGDGRHGWNGRVPIYRPQPYHKDSTPLGLLLWRNRSEAIYYSEESKKEKLTNQKRCTIFDDYDDRAGVEEDGGQVLVHKSSLASRHTDLQPILS